MCRLYKIHVWFFMYNQKLIFFLLNNHTIATTKYIKITLKNNSIK